MSVSEQELMALEQTSNPEFFFEKAGIPLSERVLESIREESFEDGVGTKDDDKSYEIENLEDSLSQANQHVEDMLEELNLSPLQMDRFSGYDWSPPVLTKRLEAPKEINMLILFMDSFWEEEKCIPPVKVSAKHFGHPKSKVRASYRFLEEHGLLRKNTLGMWVWTQSRLKLVKK